METIYRYCLRAAAVSLAILVAGVVIGSPALWQPAAVVAGVALAIGLRSLPALRTYQFTAWIVAAVVASMIYPARFLRLGPVDLRNEWIILFIVQLVMFGMGTQMSLRDFAGLGRMSYGVVIGVCLQFMIMPLVGFTLAKTLDLPPEIAAGVVLIGSCSSGLASNVMAYLSGSNLPLSITLTGVGTLMAPLITPLWMKLLAGAMVHVDFLDMTLQIIKIMIVPIGAALLHDYLKHASPRGRGIVLATAVVAVLWLVLMAGGGWTLAVTHLHNHGVRTVSLIGFLLGAVVVGVAYHGLTLRLPRLPRMMPVFSMLGIVFFTAVTTAAGRDELLVIGWLLILVVIVHNATGYLLGYYLSRACGLDQKSARTVALEVGIQNGGMASGLAGAMGKLGTVGLAAAVFSPWMNATGSILANYWRNHPVKDEFDPKYQQQRTRFPIPISDINSVLADD